MQQTKQQRGITFTVTVLAAIMACLMGLYFAQHWSGANSAQPAYQYAGTVLQQARDISDFDLMATDGEHFDKKKLQGHWTMMFFGFTHCGMMCPTAMAQLASTYQSLVKDGVTTLPQVVMVSVDPKRDSLERMQQYVTSFNPNFLGAIGSSSHVKALSSELGIAYEKVAMPNAQADDYDIQHSGAVILFNPDAKVAAFFNWPLNATDMANDYKHLVS